MNFDHDNTRKGNTVAVTGTMINDLSDFQWSGKTSQKFCVADSYKYKGEWVSQYWNCVIWDPNELESKVSDLEKGALITVVGRIKVRAYTTRDGDARPEISLSVDDFKLESPPRQRFTEEKKDEVPF